MNSYIHILETQYKDWFLNEKKAPLFKGRWRTEVFKTPLTSSLSLDLEIGIGIGDHFAYRSHLYRHRALIGIELRYKRLTQAIKKVLKKSGVNVRVVRYHAALLQDLFAEEELDHVFIHFPDPWKKRRQKKHRLIQKDFVSLLYSLQRKKGEVEIKTDDPEYFSETLRCFQDSSYHIRFLSYNLHSDLKKMSPHETHFPFQSASCFFPPFITPFERIFLKQSLPIYFVLFVKGCDAP